MSLADSPADSASAACLVILDCWRGMTRTDGERAVPEETAVALTYDRSSYAVMMATPNDLEDLGIGFSLSEGVIRTTTELQEIELVSGEGGIEVRMSLQPRARAALNRRRRYLAGPTGCGLCGIESLAEAMRQPRIVRSSLHVSAEQIAAAMAAVPQHQTLNHKTRAVHAAGFWRPTSGLVAIREDVGRHNALDKLIGALAKENAQTNDGIFVVTSRVSIEMVQKTAILGAPILVAASAPTALAVRACEQAGITLVGVARDDGFEVFTHGSRIS